MAANNVVYNSRLLHLKTIKKLINIFPRNIFLNPHLLSKKVYCGLWWILGMEQPHDNK